MYRTALRASQLAPRFVFSSVRYTVALGKSGPCCGKGSAVSTRRARRAHNKNKQWIVKRWRVCRPLLLALCLIRCYEANRLVIHRDIYAAGDLHACNGACNHRTK